MTTVYLYGALGRKFGFRFQFEISSPAEAVRALTANCPEFSRYLVQHSRPGYHVFIGADPIASPEGLYHPLGRQCIKIVPVVAGAAKSGFVGIILGVLIIAASIISFQYYGIAAGTALAIGAMGASLVIGGITQLITATPDNKIEERPENTPSDLFNGPVNTIAQGHPVPIGYGRLRVGSQVISAGISTAERL